MKCKACGAVIAIDGTSLAAARPAGAPSAPSKRPGAAKSESLSFNDETVALAPAEAASLSLQSKQLDADVSPDREDRVTPVSSPLAGSLLDDGYVDAAMNALEQKVFSVPAPKTSDTGPSAPKPSSALSAAKPTGLAQTTPKTAPLPAGAARPPTAPGSAAAKLPPKPTADAKLPPKPTADAKLPPKPTADAKLPPKPTADAKAPPRPAPSAPGAAGVKLPPKPTPPVADDEEATRMMDLPRLLSEGPSAPASKPDPDVEEPTRVVDVEEPTRMVDVEPAQRSAADEATRIFDPEPAARAPQRLPPRPSLPRAPSPGASSAPNETVTLTPEAVILSDPTPFDAPAAEPAPGATAAASDGGQAGSSPGTASGSAPRRRAGRPPGDLTVQLARPEALPAGPRSSWGLYLFVLSLAATSALLGTFFFARPAFDRAITSARLALGLEATTRASGPPFDANATSTELARVAARVSACKVPGGPSGAGRARVLFQMSGVVASAAVSPPFHGSPSEACLLELFRSARVPAFGGQPVIVTKTFRID